jgi:hypothetical protein
MAASQRGTSLFAITLALFLFAVFTACSTTSKTPQTGPGENASTRAEAAQPSAIQVAMKPGEPISLTTNAAEFQIRPDGYVQALLLKNGNKLSLDDPSAGELADSNFVRVGGKED